MPWLPDWQPPWRRLSRQQRRENTGRLHEANKALWANSDREYAAGIRHETPEYHRLNDRVNDLWPQVPPWQRSVIAQDIREARAQLRRRCASRKSRSHR